jgi:hypothetical protein
MWLFTRYGFFSFACARNADGSLDSDTVLFRARRKSHLQNLQSRFPMLVAGEIASLVERDYRYLLAVPKNDWTGVLSAIAEEQVGSSTGAENVDALQRVWDAMYSFQSSERQRALVQYTDDGAIANPEGLTADDLAEQRVLCPECRRKVFVSWPEGWDGHAGYACSIGGGTPEERKANFKEQYRRLFR